MKTNFKKIRLKLRMTRNQMAKQLDRSVGAISHYENGIRTPPMYIFQKIVLLGRKKGIAVKLNDIYPPRKLDLKKSLKTIL